MNSTTLLLSLQCADKPLIIDLDQLMAAFARVPDLRHPRGRRYPLALLLTLAVLAKLAGYSQLRDIAEWARLRQAELAQLFKLPRTSMPHPTTWSRVLAHALDPAALDQVVRQLFQRWALVRARRGPFLQISLDGKTLQGTIPLGQKQGVHLVAAYLPQAGVVLAQLAVTAKGNELTVSPTLLTQLPLAGAVVTGDAMFAQRKLSAQIVAAGGHYVWTVKRNQPELHDDIRWLFAPLRPDERASDFDFGAAAPLVEKGHGRLEERTIRVSSLLMGYSDWPGLQQVFEVTSLVTDSRGHTSRQVRYGVTSLRVAAAGPAELLQLVRGHWQQENGLHYRRDESLGEDRSQVRLGRAPQVLASLNNMVIGLAAGWRVSNLAALQRAFAYQFDKLLHRGQRASIQRLSAPQPPRLTA